MSDTDNSCLGCLLILFIIAAIWAAVVGSIMLIVVTAKA